MSYGTALKPCQNILSYIEQNYHASLKKDIIQINNTVTHLSFSLTNIKYLAIV